jgi:hypothetical protein
MCRGSGWTAAGLELPDLTAVRRYRIERVREQLRNHDCDGALLQDPLNIRYATDTTNMSLWTTHNHVRYVFVATHCFVREKWESNGFDDVVRVGQVFIVTDTGPERLTHYPLGLV